VAGRAAPTSAALRRVVRRAPSHHGDFAGSPCRDSNSVFDWRSLRIIDGAEAKNSERYSP
jgi:hypothetical protein